MVTDKAETLRLFYALWPDDAVRMALARLQEPLAGRKMHHQDLHITLAFLGQQPASLVPALQALLHQLPPSQLDFQLDRIGYFPRSRIVWAGMQAVPGALVTLHGALQSALTQHGIHSVQHGSFTPHVTLARDAPAPADTPIEAVPWHASRIVLVQSVSGPEAVRYRVL